MAVAGVVGWATGGWRDDGGGWTGGGSPGLITWFALVAAVVVLVTSRYPRGLFDLLVGLNRWVYRVIPYAALMTDRYPPFRLDQGGTELASTEPSASLPDASLPDAP